MNFEQQKAFWIILNNYMFMKHFFPFFRNNEQENIKVNTAKGQLKQMKNGF
jgi:hypothetical protein